MTFTPTEEQTSILEVVRSTNENLLISALAGSAKTTTLVMIAKALPDTQLLFLAYNKRVAVELAERLPLNCEVSTVNSLGHRAWGKALGKKLIIDVNKNGDILKALLDKLPRNQRDEAWSSFAWILEAVEYGKLNGYVPDGKYANARPVIDDETLYAVLKEEPSPLEWDLIKAVTIISIKQGWEGKIDFNDQILLPVVFSVPWPQTYPHTLVDEAQDLSRLNHVMLRKLVRDRRLTAVGDKCQSIYAFRGAHQQSMDLLMEEFDMREMLLSVSFRCPSRIVEAARWRAPHMQWSKLGGMVREMGYWSASSLPDEVTVVCRNNAPLFALALNLLKAGRYAKIVGNDIGRTLVRTLKKLGGDLAPREELHLAIDKWMKTKLLKARDEGSVRDQAECLRVFINQGETLRDAVAYAEHILTATGPVTLTTIHKAKGLEWDYVIILDEHLIRRGQEQEDNLLYVAITRTKDVLCYASSDKFLSDVPGPASVVHHNRAM